MKGLALYLMLFLGGVGVLIVHARQNESPPLNVGDIKAIAAKACPIDKLFSEQFDRELIIELQKRELEALKKDNAALRDRLSDLTKQKR